MGELNLFWEQYNQLFCFEHTIRNELDPTELEHIKNIVEEKLKNLLSYESELEQKSLIDYLDIPKGISKEKILFSVQISEIDNEKIELFVVGTDKAHQQICCTFFERVFIQRTNEQFLNFPANTFLKLGFEHREYKRSVRKKISLLFNK
ncbi:hypothetical protein [Enterococcus sp. LJL51]|uniref:hypothetical protein n=1 Tax=Enterococcus sp. LJL51 TaxID=3416656 RepID=UPI003CF69BC3